MSLLHIAWPKRAVGDHFRDLRAVALQRPRQIRICTIAPRQEYILSTKFVPQLLREHRAGVRLRNILDGKSGLPGSFGSYGTDGSDSQLAPYVNQATLQLFGALHHRTNGLRAGENDPIKALEFHDRRIERCEISRGCKRHKRKHHRNSSTFGEYPRQHFTLRRRTCYHNSLAGQGAWRCFRHAGGSLLPESTARPPRSAPAPCALQVAPPDPAERWRAASRIALRPRNKRTRRAIVRRARCAPTHPAGPGTRPAMPPGVRAPQRSPCGSLRRPKAPRGLPLPCPSTGIPPQWHLAPPPACRLPARAPPKSAGSIRGDPGPLWQPSPLHIPRSPLFAIECPRFHASRGDRGPPGGVSTALAAADCSFPHERRAADSQAWSLPGNHAHHRVGTPQET